MFVSVNSRWNSMPKRARSCSLYCASSWSWRRQVGAHRVIDQIQPQRRPGLPITERVQAREREHALVEDAAAALLVDVLGQIAGQAGHHVDPLGGQKLGQIFLPGLEQDGQVAPIDHAPSERPRGLDQEAEVWIELGRATRDVDHLDHRAGLDEGDHALGDRALHHLGAPRAGVDVAMVAGLVAALAHVDLKRGGRARLQRRQAVLVQGAIEVGTSRRHPYLPFKDQS